MAVGAVKQNASVIKESLFSVADGHVLPKLTEEAQENKWRTLGAFLKTYGKESGEEVAKDYLNDRIDESFTEPMAKEIPTLGGKIIFRSGVKAFDRNEDALLKKFLHKGE